MTSASRTISGNGFFSVIHSSIIIANEYVSDCLVVGALLTSMTSGAPYLTIASDGPDFETALLLASSTIPAIPKSQI